MQPKARILLIAVLVLTAFAVGFCMGGAFRNPSPAGGESAMQGGARGREDAAGKTAERRRLGVAEPVEGERESRLPWDEARLEAAVKSIVKERSIPSVIRRSLQLMDMLGAADFPQAMEAIGTACKGTELKDFVGIAAIARWTELDPKAAGEFMVKHKNFGGWFDFDGAIFWNVWGSNDPGAAIAFAKQMEDAGEGRSGTKAVLETMARNDPDGALAFARAHAPELVKSGDLLGIIRNASSALLPEEKARRMATYSGDAQDSGRSIIEASEAWAKEDRRSALAWAKELAGPSAKAAALLGVYRAWFESAPMEAAAAALEENQQGVDFVELAAFGVAEWPASDRAGAVTWADKLPTEPARISAYGALGDKFGGEDAKAGAIWLDSLPASAAKDAAIAHYAVRAVHSDGAGAMEWTQAISDSGKRGVITKSALKEWFQSAPAQAAEWIQSDQCLSRAEKVALLRD